MSSVRSTLLAYFAVKDRATPPAAVNRMRQRVLDFAATEGYTLELFIETLDTGTNKIDALAAKVERADPPLKVAVLEGTKLTNTYKTLLANAGAVIQTIPAAAPGKDAEGSSR